MSAGSVTGNAPSAIAPPHSFIDASEFESPAALARYLKLLDSDDARFNEYFWWRDFYERSFKHHAALCDVCERLWREEGKASSYADMRQWWVGDAGCRSGTSGLSPPQRQQPVPRTTTAVPPPFDSL